MMVVANKLGDSLSVLLTSTQVPVFAVRKDHLNGTGKEALLVGVDSAVTLNSVE